MHEFAICGGIIEVAREALAATGSPSPRVVSVTVRIGRLTAVAPDCLEHYFSLLTPGTALEGARLIIEDIPVRGSCADCGAGFEIETLSFTCPRCASGLVQLISGRELQVVCLDTAEEVARAG